MNKHRPLLHALACLLAICMTAGVFSACVFGSVLAEDGYEPSEQIVETVGLVEQLERATEKFYKTKDTFDYTTRYIRSGVYFDFRWQLMVGELDPAYEKAMEPYESLRSKRSLAVMTDRSGERYYVDLPHMAAAADAKRDFAGWAGDLITLAADISSLYEARMMLGNGRSVFSKEDIHADIDAFNLWALAKENGGSLAKAMRSYYLEGGVKTATTTFLLRETGLCEEELSAETVYEALYARLDGEACQNDTLILEEVYGVTGSEKLQYACQAFAEWLYYAHCDEIIGHAEYELYVVPPTCTRNGYTCVVCRYCGKSRYTDIVMPLSHAFSELRTEPTEDAPGVVVELCGTCGFRIESLFDDMQAGDLDCDGCLSAKDYMRLKRGVLGTALLTPRQRYLADLNGDGLLDQKDYLLCRTWFLHGRDSEKG